MIEKLVLSPDRISSCKRLFYLKRKSFGISLRRQVAKKAPVLFPYENPNYVWNSQGLANRVLLHFPQSKIGTTHGKRLSIIWIAV